VLEIAVATRSERGQREANEDKVRDCREGPQWVAVLADGAGGHQGGAEASRRSVDWLEGALHEKSAVFSAEALTQAVVAAHRELLAAQRSSQGLERMHSTVVVLWIDTRTDSALWSHVGDSRLYIARRGTLSLLTSDDSVVQRMVDAGLLTPEQALVHPNKSQLIAALGIDDEVEPHTVAQALTLEEGDAFLLCSDGWWGALDESVILGSLSDAGTPEEWLRAMQRRIEAQAEPRQDNFSAVGIWVGDVCEATRPMNGERI
jgi:serine/threonine protein phosphatase PrpC